VAWVRTRSEQPWVVVALVALSLGYGAVWLQLVKTPSQRNGLDFMAFYAAGRIAHSYGLPYTYRIELQRRVEQDVRGVPLTASQVLLYNHLPYLVPVLAVLVNENYASSLVRWAALLFLTSFCGTTFLVNSLFSNAEWHTRLAVGASLITFFPLFLSVCQGEDTAFLYLGVTLWCVGFLKQRDALAAAGLAIVTVRPPIAVLLALPHLFKGRGVLPRLLVLGGIIAFFSLIFFTVEGIRDLVKLFVITAEGTWFGMKPEVMMNILGFVVRTLPFLSPRTVSTIAWVIFGLGLAMIVLIWAKSPETSEPMIGLTIVIAVLTSPHLHEHDLTLLGFPLLFAARNEASRLQIQAPVALVGASVVFIAGIVFNSLYYAVPYGLCVLLVWWLSMSFPESKPIAPVATSYFPNP
jgi:hypothetical protein